MKMCIQVLLTVLLGTCFGGQQLYGQEIWNPPGSGHFGLHSHVWYGDSQSLLIPTGKELRRYKPGDLHSEVLRSFDGQIGAIQLTHDGVIAAVEVGDLIHLINAESGEEISRLPAPDFNIYKLAFNTDGTLLTLIAVDTKNNQITAQQLDIVNGELLQPTIFPDAEYSNDPFIRHRVNISSNGKAITFFDKLLDQYVIWDLELGSRIPVHQDNLTKTPKIIALSPDAKRYATVRPIAEGLELVLYSTETGDLETRINTPLQGYPTLLQFSGSGEHILAVGSQANVFNIAENRRISQSHFELPILHERDSKYLSPDGSILAKYITTEPCIRDDWFSRKFTFNHVLSDDILGTWPTNSLIGRVTHLEYSWDGKHLLAVDGNKRAFVYHAGSDFDGRRVQQRFDGLNSPAALSPDGRRLYEFTNETLTIHDVATKETSTIENLNATAGLGLRISPDGKRIAFINTQSVNVLNLDTEEFEYNWGSDAHELVDASMSDDGTKLLAYSRDRIFTWELNSGKLLNRVELRDDVHGIDRIDDISPDGRYAVSSNGTGPAGFNNILWRVEDAEILHRFTVEEPGTAISHMQFSADSKSIYIHEFAYSAEELTMYKYGISNGEIVCRTFIREAGSSGGELKTGVENPAGGSSAQVNCSSGFRVGPLCTTTTQNHETSTQAHQGRLSLIQPMPVRSSVQFSGQFKSFSRQHLDVRIYSLLGDLLLEQRIPRAELNIGIDGAFSFSLDLSELSGGTFLFEIDNRGDILSGSIIKQ